MADDKKGGLKMPLIHGMPWFPGTTQEMIDTFPRLSARENDIFVATYAKAGKYNNNMPAARVHFTPQRRKKQRISVAVGSRAYFFVCCHITSHADAVVRFLNGRCHLIFQLSTNFSLLNKRKRKICN